MARYSGLAWALDPHAAAAYRYDLAMPPLQMDVDGLMARMESYAAEIPAGGRRIIAIAGAPASGKSTTASRLEQRLNELAPGTAALLPMDGYHYDDEVLMARGWLARKGAPYTFDVGGYGAALERLRANTEESVAVPRFDRTIEIARAGAIIIERDVRVIVSEGNYLLLEDEPWPSLGPSFDITVLLTTEWETVEARNRQRWVDIDMDEAHIQTKLEGNDLPNARLVHERSREPDWIVQT